jgi:hypothetical protein
MCLGKSEGKKKRVSILDLVLELVSNSRGKRGELSIAFSPPPSSRTAYQASSSLGLTRELETINEILAIVDSLFLYALRE